MSADPLLELRNALSDAIGWRSQNQFLIHELHRANETNRRLILRLAEAGETERGLRNELRAKETEIRRLKAARRRPGLRTRFKHKRLAKAL